MRRELPISITLLLALATLAGCGAPAGETPPGATEVLLLSGGTVVTMDAAGTVIDDGAVAIRGERIEAVGRRAEVEARYPGARTISSAGSLVVPGLINAHTHVPMTLFRGLADDLELMDWLESRIFPAEAANSTRTSCAGARASPVSR